MKLISNNALGEYYNHFIFFINTKNTKNKMLDNTIKLLFWLKSIYNWPIYFEKCVLPYNIINIVKCIISETSQDFEVIWTNVISLTFSKSHFTCSCSSSICWSFSLSMHSVFRSLSRKIFFLVKNLITWLEDTQTSSIVHNACGELATKWVSLGKHCQNNRK